VRQRRGHRHPDAAMHRVAALRAPVRRRLCAER
jgi:hypothetical protein